MTLNAGISLFFPLHVHGTGGRMMRSLRLLLACCLLPVSALAQSDKPRRSARRPTPAPRRSPRPPEPLGAVRLLRGRGR